MLIVAVILYLIVATGLVGLAAKYQFGPVPADYHAKILVLGGAEIGDNQMLVFGAVNKVFAALFLGLGLALVFLALGGVWADLMWAKLAILVVALAAGVMPTLAAAHLEKVSGVRTPWRAGAALTVLAVIASLLSVL